MDVLGEHPGSVAPNDPHGATPLGAPANLITIAEAATRIGMKPSYLYRHTLPFIVPIGARTKRVDVQKLEKWLAKRSALR